MGQLFKQNTVRKVPKQCGPSKMGSRKSTTPNFRYQFPRLWYDNSLAIQTLVDEYLSRYFA